MGNAIMSSVNIPQRQDLWEFIDRKTATDPYGKIIFDPISIVSRGYFLVRFKIFSANLIMGGLYGSPPTFGITGPGFLENVNTNSNGKVEMQYPNGCVLADIICRTYPTYSNTTQSGTISGAVFIGEHKEWYCPRNSSASNIANSISLSITSGTVKSGTFYIEIYGIR